MILCGNLPEPLAAARDLVLREAAYIDQRRWVEWIALFTWDCEYWIPAWKADGTLASDPNAELSHLYYANRGGLEDRIARIESGRSPASHPPPRTTHIIGNLWSIDAAAEDRIAAATSWVSHVFFPLLHQSHAFFGQTEYVLLKQDDAWRIHRKKVVLQNDYIETALDIYCL